MFALAVVGLSILLILAWLFTKASPKAIMTFLKASAFAIFIVLAFLLILSGRFYTILPFVAAIPVIIPIFKQRGRSKKDSYTSGSGASGSGYTKMSLKEAFDVLGLKEGANRQEIIEAHRRLIKKIHPDQGGTDYLARKLNEAKQLLLHKK